MQKQKSKETEMTAYVLTFSCGFWLNVCYEVLQDLVVVFFVVVFCFAFATFPFFSILKEGLTCVVLLFNAVSCKTQSQNAVYKTY